MFGIVHVLRPFSDRSPAEAIRAALARCERGGRGDVPDEWLAFEDETDHVRALHTASWTFSLQGGELSIEGGDSWHLDFRAVRAEMVGRGLTRWQVRFADVEPDLAAFVERFVERLERH